ncbi:MAG TPA: ATP-dependent DNA ligase [Myxococcales bacterium]|nr:ATP-dependent DNA ligase [Myxococcales bacterium]
MLLAELVAVSNRVGSTRARLEKVRLLSELLRRATPDEVAIGVAYLSGALPQRKVGLGYATVHRIAQTPPAGAASLTLMEVDQAFVRMAGLKGSGSSTERQQLLGALFSRATAEEQDFLSRLVVGNLRQGALEGIMADAIAQAASVPASTVRRALMFSGDAPAVARAALAQGEAGLSGYRLQLFRPLQPMLAQPAADVEEALASLHRAALEWKLDGARIQVHREGDDVRVFSREGNDVSAAVPEVVDLARALPARSVVLDGEAIALRPDGSPHPFQLTMRRFGRKLDVVKAKDQLPLSPFAFDVLHLDGADLVDRPYLERMQALDALVPEAARVPRLLTGSAEEAEAFYARSVQQGHEGLLAKGPESLYEAGRRGASWLKLKPAHTLDLVVLAAEWGSGRRQGWLSNLHLGARDPAAGGFAMLGKTFKGMTDAMLQWQTGWLLAHELSRDAWTVYVRPELVAEIAFDSVQSSPHYASGMALRFARVKRYREDKRAEEADTVEAVRKIFARTHGKPEGG